MIAKGKIICFDVLGETHYGLVQRLESSNNGIKVHFEDEDGSSHFMMYDDVQEVKPENIPSHLSW